MKYTFNGGGGNDTCALWVNPDPSTFNGSEPAATANDVPSNTGGSSPVDAAAGLQIIQVRGGASGLRRDPARRHAVGSTWADVTLVVHAGGYCHPARQHGGFHEPDGNLLDCRQR